MIMCLKGMILSSLNSGVVTCEGCIIRVSYCPKRFFFFIHSSLVMFLTEEQL